MLDTGYFLSKVGLLETAFLFARLVHKLSLGSAGLCQLHRLLRLEHDFTRNGRRFSKRGERLLY